MEGKGDCVWNSPCLRTVALRAPPMKQTSVHGVSALSLASPTSPSTHIYSLTHFRVGCLHGRKGFDGCKGKSHHVWKLEKMVVTGGGVIQPITGVVTAQIRDNRLRIFQTKFPSLRNQHLWYGFHVFRRNHFVVFYIFHFHHHEFFRDQGRVLLFHCCSMSCQVLKHRQAGTCGTPNTFRFWFPLLCRHVMERSAVRIRRATKNLTKHLLSTFILHHPALLCLPGSSAKKR
mmetsp:Transcript_20801/g.48032  ORF Transcript_20801/g.48032 Transcript_20801/m.48032 type:complete len:231 (+) Transcript_20801:207-899(+)